MCSVALQRQVPAHKRVNPRPQRLHTWFNLIPVAEFEKTRPDEILFLDTFVTVQVRDDGDEPRYVVRFEDKHEMTVVVKVGVIFVWYGDDLQKPDRPFPTLWEEPYVSQYVTSKATLFEDTHVMDFVENGSDNLHFTAEDDKKASVPLTLTDDLFSLNVGAMTAQFSDAFQIPVL